MQTQAIEKIKNEISGNANNPYIQVVGQFLLQHLEQNPDHAEKILVADKTIAKSLEAMRTAAQKKKVGNVAVLTDAEGFAIVLKYFGIDGKPVVMGATATVIIEPKPAASPATDFDVSLDDFL
ncbi:hypothetical protein [Bacillus sp. T33-2]|uniref:hypothetical protein n=1 Tax=Bacillus sp. T33-2 TaxID=2054168 RepID=UPI000C75B35F|nr:hypothetical protein [Bacillus sp. T33-2]PLR93220.1 hypothetical protein CVD19_19645 [Bacillus sp. T33-2]